MKVRTVLNLLLLFSKLGRTFGEMRSPASKPCGWTDSDTLITSESGTGAVYCVRHTDLSHEGWEMLPIANDDPNVHLSMPRPDVPGGDPIRDREEETITHTAETYPHTQELPQAERDHEEL
jgi:hypothetical protein